MTRLKKELLFFLVAGCSAVGTDALIYHFLFQRLGYSPAKAVSFLTGTIVAYLLNKFLTFQAPQKSFTEFGRFGVLYSGTLVANVTVNRAILFLLPQHVLIAFLFATAVSAILNFLGQKFWVFAPAISR
jgi:putative flippase GtrA